MLGDRDRQAVAEPRSGPEEPLVCARLPELGESRQARGARDRVAVEGPGLPDVVRRALERGVEVTHDRFGPGDACQREPPGHHLAVGGEVGHDAVVLLRSAVGEAEARDDLVEDEGHLVTARRRA